VLPRPLGRFAASLRLVALRPQLERGPLSGTPLQERDMARYERVSGTLFALIAVAQLARAVLGLPAQVGTLAIPVWFSFVAFVATAGLAVWGLRSTRGAA